jgi:hypothetical protein
VCSFLLEMGYRENWVAASLDLFVSLGYGAGGTVQGLKTEVVQCSYDDHLMVSSFSSPPSNCTLNAKHALSLVNPNFFDSMFLVCDCTMSLSKASKYC